MRVFLSTLLPFYLASYAAAKAILGVDLGSLYMKVALVQRNSPLEIVTNLHSKRKTEQMVLFDRGSRFYGADASSLMPRKPLKVPQGMSVMLGRDEEHPTVQVGSDPSWWAQKTRTFHLRPTRVDLCTNFFKHASRLFLSLYARRYSPSVTTPSPHPSTKPVLV